MPTVFLKELAYARSGDKGDVCNVGIMAKSPRIYDRLVETLTAEVNAEHYGDMVQGKVEVYAMPNIHSIAIVLRGGLGGGATRTLRFDQTGKAMGCALLRLELEVEDDLLREAQRRTSEIEKMPS